MHRFQMDLVCACRSMRSRPCATAAMLAILVLGTGLTTAMYALADPFLLRPLPYTDPVRLVVIESKLRMEIGNQASDAPIPTISDWQSHAELFESLAAYGSQMQIRVQTNSGAKILRVVPVSQNFFDVLGIRVNSGAPWHSQDVMAEYLLAVSLGARTRVFGSPEELLDRSFITEGAGSVRVSALLPASFLFPAPRATQQPEALTPRTFGPIIVRSPGKTERLTVIARLRPGVTPENVQATLSAQLASSPFVVKVLPIMEFMAGDQRPLALGALAAALLISFACSANIANLLIARGAYRIREFAVREALGASRLDLLRLVVIELGVVASLAIAISLVLADLVLAVMTKVIPIQYTTLGPPEVSLRVTCFAILLGAAIVGTASIPVWITLRKKQSLGIGQSLSSEARKVKWLRTALAGSQSATAMVLLLGSTLLMRSYINLWSQDTGFSGNVGIISVSYPRDERPERLNEEIGATLEGLRRIPGILIAGAVTGPLLDGGVIVGGTFVRVAGRSMMLPSKEITTGFFDAVGMRLRAGRLLASNDHGWNAVVVNEAFARWLWTNTAMESVVGQTGILADGRTVIQIVGVVGDTYDKALDKTAVPRVYRILEKPVALLPVNYVVRLHERSTHFDIAARHTIASVNADAVVVEASLLEERLAGTVRDRSFSTLMLSLFTAAGLGITASGMFGIVASLVARRTREIAIRRAVGAQARHLLWVVVREMLTAATLGSAVGYFIGHWLSKFLESWVYGITPGDAGSAVTAALMMIAVVALAAWIPAKRALRLSPSEALRVE